MTFKEKLETHRKVVILGAIAGTGQNLDKLVAKILVNGLKNVIREVRSGFAKGFPCRRGSILLDVGAGSEKRGL